MQFFPLCILAAAYFAYVGCKGSERLTGSALVGARSVRSHIRAVRLFGLEVSPWLAHFAAILLFLAWGLGRCGTLDGPA